MALGNRVSAYGKKAKAAQRSISYEQEGTEIQLHSSQEFHSSVRSMYRISHVLVRFLTKTVSLLV